MIETAAIIAVVLPLVAALANGANAVAGGRLYGPPVVARAAVAGTFGSLAASVVVVIAMLGDPGTHHVVVYRWLASGDLSVDFALLIDPLSVVMMLVVTAISWLVTRFSVNYMHNEDGFARYFTVVPLFVFAMLVLVTADSYLLMFLGWEGVGVCSYLLIGFYRDRPASAQAGTRAFVMNRVGDASLLVAMFLLAVHSGSLRYGDVFAEAASLPPGMMEAVGFLLLFGAVGKSAQLPLGTWLARAMEGPTPSSALIHAATMVTAGVYLIVRSSPLFDLAPNALLAVGIVGAATVLYAQLVGYAQTDVKGMLAASTMAQLGMMFVFCGLGLYGVAMFHLVVHAFYKSYLFLTAPSILHHLHGRADPTAVRQPDQTAPAVSALVLVAAALVVALPLVARAAGGPDELGRNLWVVAGLGVAAAFAVVFSTQRMVKVAFAGDGHGPDGDGPHGAAHRRPLARLGGPLAVVVALGALGVAAGVLPGGLEGTWFHRLLGDAAAGAAAPAGSPALAALLGVALVLVLTSGVYGPRYFDRFRAEQPAGAAPPLAQHLYWGALNRGYLDDVYDRTFVRAAGALGGTLSRFDRQVLAPAATANPSFGRAGDSWQAQFEAVRRAHARGAVQVAEPLARLDWLTVPAEPPATGQESGQLRDRIAAATAAVERVMFQGSLERGYRGLTHVIAAFTEAVERLVFQSGVERALATSGSGLQRLLLAFETRLGRPWVGAALLVAALISLLVGTQ
ncbi:MAG TPA: NADH-quinone oxidoreductase subunit L [Acidimicrobiales bacterium]|nr:NADH-quinone oxidoreductase subunit L [Acidimicrobiales bacterium]